MQHIHELEHYGQMLHIFVTSLLMMQVLETTYNHALTHSLMSGLLLKKNNPTRSPSSRVSQQHTPLTQTPIITDMQCVWHKNKYTTSYTNYSLPLQKPLFSFSQNKPVTSNSAGGWFPTKLLSLTVCVLTENYLYCLNTCS